MQKADLRRRRAARIERAVLAVIAALSLGWSGWWLWQVAQLPAATLLVERVGSNLQAAYERDLQRVATSEAVAERLAARLDEAPRDWVVIGALMELAEVQGLELPPELLARHQTLYAQDNGWIASGLGCAACAWDLRDCDLSLGLACGVAVNVTVLGDLVALTREGGNYLAGLEVDQVDLGIAFVGIAATGLVVVTGGTSLVVKGGAALLRVAHRTGRVAPEVMAVFRRAFTFGIDWARMPAVRGSDDLLRLARPEVLRPAVRVAQDLGRMEGVLGARQTLHLMRAADTPTEIARLSRAADGLGPRTLGAFEMLGKSRFFRLGLRMADEVIAVIAGLFAALTSLAALLGPLLARLLRPALRLGLRGALRLVLR
ncbi:hypothetical protein [Pararhodobacter oceanensis]|uniref:Uncharacterized protein n=1 Tax=Pararhodobacter oceanensis TaxID=2172121 RepID=A0A2T8HUS1_9RHOB|nr:hypothetical protein [Pararhodobacter oceanensis]PVH29209.1 hypothetical protein DDE20_09345 [Pararhodobacter oceanensis]